MWIIKARSLGPWIGLKRRLTACSEAGSVQNADPIDLSVLHYVCETAVSAVEGRLSLMSELVFIGSTSGHRALVCL